MGYQVAWEKVAVHKDDGTDNILNRGQYLPENVDDFTLGVLTSVGAVTFRDDSAVELVVAQTFPPEGQPSAPPHLPAREAGVEPDPDPGLGFDTMTPTQTGDPAASTDPEGPPARQAPKGDWVDYAVSRGLGRTEAERLSKDALVNRYGN